MFNTMRTTTKMYLSIILSTACIMVYQYQLSKAGFLSLQGNGGNNNNSAETNEVLLKSQHKINHTNQTMDNEQWKNAHHNNQLSKNQIATVVLVNHQHQNEINRKLSSSNIPITNNINLISTATFSATKSNGKTVITYSINYPKQNSIYFFFSIPHFT